MESIKELKQIVKPIAANKTANPGANKPDEYNIKYSNKPEPKNYFVRLPGHETTIKKEYFKNYRSYKIYYKAHLIKYIFNNLYVNDERIGAKVPGGNKIIIENERIINNVIFEVITSYETPIGILTPEGYLLLNYRYYNCSTTTRNQLNFYIQNNKEKITRTFYLSESNFKIYLEDLQKENLRHIRKNHHKIITSNAAYEKQILNIFNDPSLTNHEKAIKLLKAMKYNPDIKPNLCSYETRKEIKELKTRNRIKHTFYFSKVKFYIEYSERKRSARRLSKFKCYLDDEQILFSQDLRNFKESLIYTGVDIGVTNTKDLKYKSW